MQLILLQVYAPIFPIKMSRRFAITAITAMCAEANAGSRKQMSLIVSLKMTGMQRPPINHGQGLLKKSMKWIHCCAPSAKGKYFCLFFIQNPLFIINSFFLVSALPVLSKLSRHISYLYLRDPKGSSYNKIRLTIR